MQVRLFNRFADIRRSIAVNVGVPSDVSLIVEMNSLSMLGNLSLIHI